MRIRVMSMSIQWVRKQRCDSKERFPTWLQYRCVQSMTMHETSSSFGRFTCGFSWPRRGRMRSNNSSLARCILNLPSVLVTTSVCGEARRSVVHDTALLFHSCPSRWLRLDCFVEKWVTSFWGSFRKAANLVQNSQRHLKVACRDQVGACCVCCSKVVTHWDIRDVRAVVLFSFMVSCSSMAAGTNAFCNE